MDTGLRVAAGSLVLAFVPYFSARADQDHEHQKACEHQLHIAYEAIQAYRATYGDVPGKLGDLIPKFVSDPSLFRCPTSGFGDYKLGRALFTGNFDSNRNITYTYQFHDDVMEVPFSDGRIMVMTGKERKTYILSTPFGNRVPILSCMRHLKDSYNRLNISYDGKFYTSHEYWECAAPEIVPAPYLTLWHLGPHPGGVASRIPPRDPALPAHCIDLTPGYNAHPEDAWFEWMWTDKFGGAGLPGFTPGALAAADGLPAFDARGIIQLNGEKFQAPFFPLKSREIPVGRPATSLHVLLGCISSAARGTPVGHIHLRYIDGKTAQQPVRYGENVTRFDGGESAAAPVAWEGRRERDGAPLRLYLFRWDLPHPGETVDALWFSATGRSDAAPFFLAVSTEG